MGVYDQLSRYLVKGNPHAFFAWQIPKMLRSFAFEGFEDTRTVAFPGEPDRVCDTVARFHPLKGKGDQRLLDFEFETEPSEDVLERTGEYTYRLRREIRYGPGKASKYRVIPVIVYLTGPVQKNTLDTREKALGGVGIFQKVLSVSLATLDGVALLARIEAGELARIVLPWLALMRGMEDDMMVKRWRAQAEQEPDAALRGDLGELALIFAELAGRSLVWKKALEGFNVQTSPRVLEWEMKGEARRQRANILHALEVRCRVAVPVDIRSHLEAVEGWKELDRWFDAALTADDLEAFRRAVGLPPA